MKIKKLLLSFLIVGQISSVFAEESYKHALALEYGSIEYGGLNSIYYEFDTQEGFGIKLGYVKVDLYRYSLTGFTLKLFTIFENIHFISSLDVLEIMSGESLSFPALQRDGASINLNMRIDIGAIDALTIGVPLYDLDAPAQKVNSGSFLIGYYRRF